MSESDNIFKAVKAIKKSKINEEPDDERLKDFGGSEDNLFFKLEYTLIGEIPAFVSCHIFYMGTEIPSDRLKFSGDIWKIVCPGWHQFTWNLKNHPDLLMAIPDGISGVTFNFSLKTKEV